MKTKYVILPSISDNKKHLDLADFLEIFYNDVEFLTDEKFVINSKNNNKTKLTSEVNSSLIFESELNYDEIQTLLNSHRVEYNVHQLEFIETEKVTNN